MVETRETDKRRKHMVRQFKEMFMNKYIDAVNDNIQIKMGRNNRLTKTKVKGSLMRNLT